MPIELSGGVKARIDGEFLVVSGPKGELRQKTHELVGIDIQAERIVVSVKNPESKKEKAFWGLYRSLVDNMVTGVRDGFSKKLEVVGVGYRVAGSGKKLTFNVGYSHPVEFELPEGISASVEANTVTIEGFDKQLVGETAARIRKIRKPEPYKGKGIKYADEIIIRKEGKAAAKGD